jgi:hypothetical protein
MKNGAVSAVLEPNGSERGIIETVSGMDSRLWELRERIRNGEMIPDRQSSVKMVGVRA